MGWRVVAVGLFGVGYLASCAGRASLSSDGTSTGGSSGAGGSAGLALSLGTSGSHSAGSAGDGPELGTGGQSSSPFGGSGGLGLGGYPIDQDSGAPEADAGVDDCSLGCPGTCCVASATPGKSVCAPDAAYCTDGCGLEGADCHDGLDIPPCCPGFVCGHDVKCHLPCSRFCSDARCSACANDDTTPCRATCAADHCCVSFSADPGMAACQPDMACL
ncbi:MAG TPA: hypothetical protein VGI10_00705 [Polyangiaceae bacterium]|jgi:hypothetical protein